MKSPAGFILSWIFPRKRWLVTLAGLLIVFFSCETAVRIASASLLEKAVGVRVSVSRLAFKPYPLVIGLYGVKVHNPEGFREKVLADLPEIYFEINPLAVLKGRIHVREVRLAVKDVVIERNAAGKINLTEMMRLLRERTETRSRPAPGEKPRAPEPRPAPEPSTDKPQKPKKPIPVIVDRVVVNVGEARYVESGKQGAAERRLKMNIQNLELKNVTDPASVTEQIVVMVLKKMGLMAVNAQLGDLQQSFEKQAKVIVDQIQQTFQEWMK